MVCVLLDRESRRLVQNVAYLAGYIVSQAFVYIFLFRALII
jgi:hypothetical protein